MTRDNFLSAEDEALISTETQVRLDFIIFTNDFGLSDKSISNYKDIITHSDKISQLLVALFAYGYNNTGLYDASSIAQTFCGTN
jgi:hypothetical protein